MSDLNFFVNSRKYLRKAVTEAHNKKDSYSSLPDVDKKAIRLDLEEYLNDLNDLDSKIRTIKWDNTQSESELEKEIKVSKEYSRKIKECLVLLEITPSASSGSAADSVRSSGSAADSVRSLLKNPVAPLPKFESKEGEDLHRFFSQFEETLSKFSYPDYDKLLLLKQQVKGRASILLNSLECDKQTYADAKKLLIDALASTTVRKFNVIKQLADIKLSPNADPFEYISKMKYITESVKDLAIDVDSFLQYFFWQGLNDDFKGQLIQITNETKPSLKNINDHFFEACDRFKNVQSAHKAFKNKSPRDSSFDETTNFAVNVDYNNSNVSKRKFTFKPCSICPKVENKEVSHPIHKCPKYKTASEKLSQLKILKGCTKCANLNHETSACTYRFNSRCGKCKQWHMYYLCTKASTESRKPLEKQAGVAAPSIEKVSVSGLTVIEALQSEIEGDTILPTFTCEANSFVLRGLKDGGCQSNFISEKMANQLNLKVIKYDVSLTVRGINIPKKYVTKLVELNLKFGIEERVITALCLPSINIVLNLPNLHKIVDSFVSKGYDLADKYLIDSGDKIDNIDLILGAKSSYCISEREITFGKDNCSVYSQTSLGVILKGDMNRYLADLEFLPMVSDNMVDGSPCPGPEYNSMNCLAFEGNNCLLPAHGNFNCFEDSLSVFDSDKVGEEELQRTAEEILDKQCSYHVHLDDNVYDEESYELNTSLVKFVLDNTVRDENGRLEMPLLWNAKVSHLLGKNLRLATMILKSNLKNLAKNAEKLKLMDATFKEQEDAGIIERIENLDEFLQLHPEHSFLPHMAVIKPDRETTKCRIVFLSNLCEREAGKAVSLSHNQTIHSGPSLNQKLSAALLHLKFDTKMLIFDIKKAFNNISLNETDQNKLLFLWFRNVEKGDFSIVAFRNVRLSFGLRCSPTLLMLGLYKILVLDTEHDSSKLKNLKSLVYQLSYMDNCAVTALDSHSLGKALGQLHSIFDPYHFGLQQFVCNDDELQSSIDDKYLTSTPSKVKLLGMEWNRVNDTISTKPICLNLDAKTKRQVLMTIASQFDIYQYNGPILNRSRLFLHRLQCQKDLGWDENLPTDQIKEWKNIARQANSTPEIAIKRSVGRRDGRYRLIGFCDSSKLLYGVVIYIKDLDTGEINFLLSKNRIINKQLESKSIPSLEMQSISLATECILDVFHELSGPSCIKPINVVDLEIFSDSLVSLTWLNSYTTKMDKMQKRSVFVLNRINLINKLCEKHPIRFSFVSGAENPADAVTRCISPKQLFKTCYFSGPDFICNSAAPELSREDLLSLTIPNPLISRAEHTHVYLSNVGEVSHLVPPDKFSRFSRIVSVHSIVLSFINKLKANLRNKYPDRFGHLQVKDSDFNYFSEASKQIIMREQLIKYPEVVEYFQSGSQKIKDMPNIVAQLNIYMDQEGLLRVKSKCERMKRIKRYERFNFPLLLSKNGRLTDLLVLDMHKKFSHAGCYTLLSELRKKFWIPHFFSVVKKVIKSCVICKRYNERAIKLNQSSYRECRLDPVNIPFNNMYMDFMGPFLVKTDSQSKVWILCITCMWSRAINLKVCINLSVAEFLRAFSLHCFEYGIPSLCITDLGTQLTAGANVITDFLKDHETQRHFHENGIKPLTFQQYYKGHSELGSVVEICVKMTKRLLSKAISKTILSFRDFEFLVCKTVHLVNRRPVAFKESLRDSSGSCVPCSITPECLVRGYDLLSLNVIPELQSVPDDWLPDPQAHVKSGYEKLRKVRQRLIESYNEEFLSNLVYQAINLKDRYRPVLHKEIKPGDVVLIKEPFAKPSNYPMGIVKSIVKNDNGEVTGAMVMKGKTREIVKRHSSTLVPLLILNDDPSSCSLDQISDCSSQMNNSRSNIDLGHFRPRRQAAIKSEQSTKAMLRDEGN